MYAWSNENERLYGQAGYSPTREQVIKLRTWGCAMYLHNYIWPTFVILASFVFPFYYIFFLVKKSKPLFSNPIEVNYLVTVYK